jgi:predicted transcriptional regulator/ADP-ribose pyrophosphatase YjhB (NUDIX family)
MQIKELHSAQVSILRTLRHNESVRYSVLMRPTTLESDVFKFHLRKLVHQKYVEKKTTGEYLLTSKGKEFANNLSKTELTVQKQPKLSVAIIASKHTKDGSLYLVQKRFRNPFYGFWGCISGPVQWGEPIEVTARREFEKQTGLSASYKVKSFYRKGAYDKDTDEILEDKLFAVVEAINVKGQLNNAWPGGFNTWMSSAELEAQEKYFNSSRRFIDIVGSKTIYSSEKALYKNKDY